MCNQYVINMQAMCNLPFEREQATGDIMWQGVNLEVGLSLPTI